MDIFERIPPVDFRLARTQKVEVRPAEDIYRFRHGPPFALERRVLQEGNRRLTAMKITVNASVPMAASHRMPPMVWEPSEPPGA